MEEAIVQTPRLIQGQRVSESFLFSAVQGNSWFVSKTDACALSPFEGDAIDGIRLMVSVGGPRNAGTES